MSAAMSWFGRDQSTADQSTPVPPRATWIPQARAAASTRLHRTPSLLAMAARSRPASASGRIRSASLPRFSRLPLRANRTPPACAARRTLIGVSPSRRQTSAIVRPWAASLRIRRMRGPYEASR